MKAALLRQHACHSGTEGAQQEEAVAGRAKQLAQVAAVWHGNLATIRLPLEPQNALVAVIAAASKPGKVRCLVSVLLA